MSVGTILIISVAAIVLAILIGWKTKINIGMVCIAFAYILGTFILGQSGYAVIGYWPTSSAFQMISVLAFYGFAKSNGALELVTRKTLYAFRQRPQVLPFVIFFVILLLGAAAGPLSVNSFMPVLTFAIAQAAGWPPVMFSVVCCIGAVVGSSLPFSEIGGYMFNALVSAGYETAVAESLTWKIGITAWVVCAIFFLILYFACKGYKGCAVEMEKTGKATPEQKKTLAVVGVVIGLMVIPSFLKVLMPGSVFAMFAGKMNLPLLCVAGFVVCALLKLGSSRDVITTKIPWDMIMMLSGISMLVGVASAAGATDYLGQLIGQNVPPMFIGTVFALLAAGLSFFIPFWNTFPIMIPLIPAIVEATGLNPVMLAACVLVGGITTSISPFSSGGAFIMAQCPDENLRQKLFVQHIVLSLGGTVLVCILSLTGILGIIR